MRRNPWPAAVLALALLGAGRPAWGIGEAARQTLDRIRAARRSAEAAAATTAAKTSAEAAAKPVAKKAGAKPAAKEPADRLVLEGGDRLTGELVDLFDGKVTFKAYGNEAIKIPWTLVKSLVTTGRYRSTLKKGSKIDGAFVAVEGGGFAVATQLGPIAIPADEFASIDNFPHIAKLEKEAVAKARFDLGAVWSGKLSFGYADTSGNSESTNINADVEGTRKTVGDKLFIDGHYQRAQATGVRSADAVRGGMRLDVNLKPKQFIFVFGRIEVDKIQQLDLRTVVGSGLGHTLYDRPGAHLDVGAGITYTRETYENTPKKSDMTALVSINWNRKISARSTFSERLLYYPDFSDLSDYRLESDTAFDVTIGRNLYWTVGVSDRFDATPLTGKEKNDLTVKTAITQKF